ncbi:MAG TPA: hypothetical protein VHQ03_10860 [Candidatus Dormibacteraeota bacterium]|nr:hypothetical protein [Candidatus Dormibacteraeota bacterium]
MPDLSHLWQRFLLASALVFGLLLGVGATVFSYSNTETVTVGWSVWRLEHVPVWTVALVPVVLVLVAGTIYHWYNSFHHFTQHMRHRHRVRELEAENRSLKERLDHLLEMPGSAGITAPAVEPVAQATAPALPEPAAGNGEDKSSKKSRKRISITTDSEPVTVSVDRSTEPTPTEPEPAAAPAEETAAQA